MSLLPLVGHEDLRVRLKRAVELGRVPQSLLFHGPTGIGKQRLCLWLASLVECEGDFATGQAGREGEEGKRRPCGTCRPCRLVNGLQHPDVHWFFPLPSVSNSTPQKKREKLEQARLEELAAWREEPLRPSEPDTSRSIFLEAVNEMRAKAVRRPAMGRATVFVIGEADRMIPQASTPDAANAFLKLLEEPPPHVLLFLTSSRPGALLPTIRSRVLGVRVLPPPEDTAAAFLAEHAGLDEERARRLARRAGGSIGVALRLAAEEESEDAGDEALQLFAVALSGSAADRLRAAVSVSSWGARGAFSTTLIRLAEVLRDAIAVRAGAADAVRVPERFARLAALESVPPDALLRCTTHVESALAAATGNVNPQAIVVTLLGQMAAELQAGRKPLAGRR